MFIDPTPFGPKELSERELMHHQGGDAMTVTYAITTAIITYHVITAVISNR